MTTNNWSLLAGVLAVALTAPQTPPPQRVTTVALLAPAASGGPVTQGLLSLRAALAERGLRVVDGRPDTAADFYVRLGVDAARGPESLSIARATVNGHPAIELRGGDAVGLMYAAFDTADRIRWASGADPFAFVRSVSERPFLHERGVSMYTMQRALFEQKLYDESYWIRYFDLLSHSRINTFVVIFGYENGGFMAPPYPYFYDTPGFTGVGMVGLT